MADLQKSIIDISPLRPRKWGLWRIDIFYRPVERFFSGVSVKAKIIENKP
jgi:hypothetical protein